MQDTKILIIDDEKEMCKSIEDVLLRENIYSDFSLVPAEGLRKIEKEEFDVILLDYQLPGMNGFELIDEIKKKNLWRNTKTIFMTAYGDLKTGIEAIEKGCFDYIAKPFNIENLMFRIERALEHKRLNEKIKMLSQRLDTDFEDIIGTSLEMKKIFKIVKQIADKDITVLIEGETGTGKELIAKAIHKNSKRKNNLFMPLNCGALPETLLESELFGYEKGAFTGAVTIKYGILETANNGIVFLDEINGASLNAQSKLLRFIEAGEFMRIGGNRVIHSNARIIAASNQNIENLIKENRFRQDLYHRLNVVRIVMPILNKRKEDIPLLTDYFLEKYNRKFKKEVIISKTALDYLIKYQWPGNVRQLQNLIQSSVLLNETGIIEPEDLPEVTKKDNPGGFRDLTFKELKNESKTDFEIKLLKELLEQTKGNVSKASRMIHLSRTNIIKKLKAYNIDSSMYK